MSGGEETQLGTRLRHRRVAKAAGNSDSLDLRQPPLDSTRVAGYIMKDCLSSVRYWPYFEGLRLYTVLGAPWLV